ncbi:MAG: outer membrane lipoprotein carrier protein LolA [Deltaproteobacteria bacterium]|nr:outer membrane lipoprotein carrier protein LolA [Deltaproteobacteria bacterium]
MSRAAVAVVLLLALAPLPDRGGAARAETRPGGAAACPDPATIVRKLQERYDGTRTFRANVRQEMKVKSLDVSDVSEGTVVFKKPGKMRWDFQTPRAQQIVSDGDLLWIYQPDDRQVLKAPFRAAFVSTTPVSFLLGVGRITDDFRPEADARGCTAERLYVALASKRGDEVGALAFGVDPATYDIVEASVTDPLGNVTTLGFSAIARNVDVPDATFAFTVPSGVDVITPPGAAAAPPP